MARHLPVTGAATYTWQVQHELCRATAACTHAVPRLHMQANAMVMVIALPAQPGRGCTCDEDPSNNISSIRISNNQCNQQADTTWPFGRSAASSVHTHSCAPQAMATILTASSITRRAIQLAPHADAGTVRVTSTTERLLVLLAVQLPFHAIASTVRMTSTIDSAMMRHSCLSCRDCFMTSATFLRRPRSRRCEVSTSSCTPDSKPAWQGTARHSTAMHGTAQRHRRVLEGQSSASKSASNCAIP